MEFQIDYFCPSTQRSFEATSFASEEEFEDRIDELLEEGYTIQRTYRF